jgi:hypothetical protein
LPIDSIQYRDRPWCDTCFGISWNRIQLERYVEGACSKTRTSLDDVEVILRMEEALGLFDPGSGCSCNTHSRATVRYLGKEYRAKFTLRKESVQGHKDIIEDLRQLKEKREKHYDGKCERPDGPSGAAPAAEPAGSGAPSSNPGSAPGSDPKFIPLPPPILHPATVPRPATPSVPLVVPLPKGIIWCIISRQCGQGGVIQTE